MHDGSPPSYEHDVKPLFRDRDRSSMPFMFDLWSYEHVRGNADAIALATEAGEMPCDGTWPADRTRLFRAWIDGGFQP